MGLYVGLVSVIMFFCGIDMNADMVVVNNVEHGSYFLKFVVHSGRGASDPRCYQHHPPIPTQTS